ncbi:MAG: hypothetical protein JNM77_11965 [Pseudonocardia sp.]|nr:hypothetical protein [Pseudonocardia sp.]
MSARRRAGQRPRAVRPAPAGRLGAGHDGRRARARAAGPLAGVELGTYDERIVAWLARWDVPTVGALVSLLGRAAGGTG